MYDKDVIEPYKKGARVNNKMSGRNSPLYFTITFITMQGHQTKTKTEDMISLDYSSICYITSIGSDGYR